MSKLLPVLIEIAERHLPQLEHDIDNASTLYTLQAAVKQLHQYVTYVLHHEIQTAYASLAASMGQVAPAPAPAVAPAAATPPPVSSPLTRPIASQSVHHASSVATLALPRLSGPGPGPGPTPLQTPGTAPAQQGQRVMDVSITPSGTHVQIPGGPAMTLPPGTPVTREVVEPQPVVMGPNDVVLPPGGGMTADVAAALAAAGGARNITSDPVPGQ